MVARQIVDTMDQLTVITNAEVMRARLLLTRSCLFISVLETRVLISKSIEDKNESLGLGLGLGS